MIQTDNKATAVDKLHAVLKGISMAAAIFSLVVAALIFITYIQLAANNPINTNAVNILADRLRDNTSDAALRDEVRALDLVARKAYFTSLWQINFGSWLLLGGAVLAIGCALAMGFLKPKPKTMPDDALKNNVWKTRGRTQIMIAIAGGALLTGAVVHWF